MSSSKGNRRRLVAGGAMFAGAAVVGRGIAKRRPAVRQVAADLRSPVLYVPLNLRSERSLGVIRKLMAKRPSPLAADVEVSDRTANASAGGSDEAPATRVVMYEPTGRMRPSGALLWIHGGGMVAGGPDQDNAWCSAIANELGILVVSVDYRLAPEHPFPAALTDCYTTLTWLHEQADDLGVDADRIAVGGASAGGGLSASLCQFARDRGGPAICFQLLNYPMLDDRSVLRTDHQGRGEFIWTPPSNRFGWSAYLGQAPSPVEAPLHAAPARTADLAGLPPAWIGVGDLDLFYEEDVDYAARLEAAGVPCKLRIEPGMYHGADLFLVKVPRMKAYRGAMLEALRAAVGVSWSDDRNGDREVAPASPRAPARRPRRTARRRRRVLLADRVHTSGGQGTDQALSRGGRPDPPGGQTLGR